MATSKVTCEGIAHQESLNTLLKNQAAAIETGHLYIKKAIASVPAELKNGSDDKKTIWAELEGLSKGLDNIMKDLSVEQKFSEPQLVAIAVGSDYIEQAIAILGPLFPAASEDLKTIWAEHSEVSDKIKKVLGESVYFTEQPLFPAVLVDVDAVLTINAPLCWLPVIGPEYTLKYKTIYELQNIRPGEFSFSQSGGEGNQKFRTMACKTHVHRGLELLNGGKRIAMALKNIISVHGRWEGYICEGEDKSSQIKVFNLCKPSIFGNGMDVRVTLERSSSEDVDFKIIVNSKDKTCSIYKANGSAIIAETLENEGKWTVEVYPGVDCAFVFLLIATVDAMNKSSKVKGAVTGALEVVACVGAHIAFDEVAEEV